MYRRADITTYGDDLTPEPGVFVTVLNYDGTIASIYNDAAVAIANPVASDNDGSFYYNVLIAGTYIEEYRLYRGETPRKVVVLPLGTGGTATVYSDLIAIQAAALDGYAAAIAAVPAAAAAIAAQAGAVAAQTAVLGALSGITLTNATIDAANRTILAALATSLPAYLREAGREGMFVFDSSNLSAKVTADPNQGVYVAPSATPSGASGAWVRKFSGPLNVKWFGATGDGTTNDSAAILATIAVSKALKTTGYGYGFGGPPVYLPTGVYNCVSTTISWDHPLHFYGDYGSGPTGGGTVLKWSSNVTGLRVVGDDSTGGGVGSIVRNVLLKGAYTTVESEAHGIDVDAKCTIRDVYIEYFAGDGINLDSTGVNTNQNDSEIYHPFVRYCRNGIYIYGNDCNAITIFHPEMFLNRRYGVWFKDTLGRSSVFGGDFSSNGWDSLRPTMCIYSSKHYYVLPGQETWCQTNAPSGTTANNTGWGYLSSIGGAYGASEPSWVSGITTWRAGGALYMQGGSNYNLVVGGYQEGDGPPVMGEGNCLFIHADAVLADGSVYGGFITGTTAQVSIPRTLNVGSSAGVSPRGAISFGGNVDEYFRTVDSTAASGWYLHGGANGLYFTNAVTAVSPFVVSGASGLTFGRSAPVTDVFNAQIFALGSGSNARIYGTGTAAPTTGYHAIGEIVFNPTPSAAGKIGWVCTSSGTPGTWKPWGVIDA